MTASAGSRQSLKSRVRGTSHARFGGGGGETQFGCAPCAYPTRQAAKTPGLCRGPLSACDSN